MGMHFEATGPQSTSVLRLERIPRPTNGAIRRL
jgi:hypothetical protein